MLTKDAIDQLAKAEAITAGKKANPAEATLALPNDFTLHDVEKFMPARRRARGTMITSAIEDFAQFATRHAFDGAAAVFVNGPQMAAMAVLNIYTGAGDPGHCDFKAELKAQITAPHKAMRSMLQRPLSQQQLAEFLEDWPPHIVCLSPDGQAIVAARAIAAVRRITIEGLRKVESQTQQLSQDRTTFESVKATSTDPLPAFVAFKCAPYFGLDERTFVMRLSIRTGDKDPALGLHLVNGEQHDDDMAQELAQRVRNVIGNAMPVMVGSFNAGN